jgi:IclR family KDG regulon transcriptional repressor
MTVHNMNYNFILTLSGFYLQSVPVQHKFHNVHDDEVCLRPFLSPTAVTVRKSAARSQPDAPGSSKSLQKALRILLHLGQHGPEMGITDLASTMGLNKTTVYRLLNAMQKFELVEQNPDNERYRLGLKLHELGLKALESRTLQREAHRFLLEMSRRSQETVSLAVPTPGSIICLDRVNSPDAVISISTGVGARFPAHCTAVGKAVLAYLSEEQVDAIVLNNGLPQFTPATLTRLPGLRENLRHVRERGYAIDNQELERGLSGVAAPVRTAKDTVIAAVGMAGPTLRFRGPELRQKISLVKEIARKLSVSLGYIAT